MPRLLLIAVGVLAAPWLPAQDLSAADILARLAENQERADKAREFVVYRQETRMKILRGPNKIAREDHRVYTVTPKDQTTSKHLDSFEGRYEKGGKLYPYDAPRFKHKDVDIDGELIGDLTTI